tara:strand:- start:122093 stop:122413 length:321 start_codon:yes stop_codon:yes gene_type:complete
MKSLKQYVGEYSIEKGYSLEEEFLYETFIECLSEGVVQEETVDERRWYKVRYVVHKVTIEGQERFFQTYDYHITGDNCARDMGLDMPTLDSVVEVFPEEITTTIYR